MKINVDKFSIQYTLSCPLGTILVLYVSSMSLFLPPSISNPPAPPLEHMNPSWLNHDRNHPNHPKSVAYNSYLVTLPKYNDDALTSQKAE